MKRMLKIYLVSLKNSFAARMAYRGDFFFCCIMVLVSELLMPLLTVLIYSTGASFPGWDLPEIMVLQGIFVLSRGTANLLFFGMVYNTLSHVREGTYDLFMIKPASTLFMSIATGFEPDSVGTITGGLLVTILALRNLPMPGIVNILQFLLFFIFSLISLFSFAVLMSATVFKWVGNSRIYEIFDSIAAFGNYPMTIFSRTFQAIISYVIPVSVIAFYPASALLVKDISGIFSIMLVCIVFFLLSLGLWRLMLSKYNSAGG